MAPRRHDSKKATIHAVIEDRSKHNRPGHRMRRPQFTIWRLMTIIAIVGVTLGVVLFFVRMPSDERVVWILPILGCCGFTCVFTPFLVIFAFMWKLFGSSDRRPPD
jgi:hypothetical protein